MHFHFSILSFKLFYTVELFLGFNLVGFCKCQTETERAESYNKGSI